MRTITLLFSVFICVAVNAQIPSWMPVNGLVAWYPFNGNANDESGNGNNGAVYGATLAADRFGDLNRSYSFNGINNRIEIADTPSLRLRRMTLALWIKTNNTSLSQILYKARITDAQYEAYSLDLTLRSSFKNNSSCATNAGWISTIFSTQPIANTWMFIASTFDGNSVRNYVNGVLVATNSFTGLIDSCVGGNLRFGYGWNNYPFAFSGLIDDISIYNRALDSCEIQQLFKQNNTKIVFQPQNQNVIAGSSTQFGVSASGTGLSYQWQQDGGTGFTNLSNAGVYSGVNTDTLTISNVSVSQNNFHYRCFVSSAGLCADTSNDAVLSVITSVGQTEKHENVEVYPNPATDAVTLRSSSSGKSLQFTITDVVGHVLLKGVLGAPEQHLSLSTLSKGIYYLRIQGKQTKVIKLIKQ